MKTFDLEKALNHEPVQTRDGRTVTQVTMFVSPASDEPVGRYPIAAVIVGPAGIPLLERFTVHGSHTHRIDREDRELLGHAPSDLFMAPVTKTLWLNIYPDVVNRHSTRNGADANALSSRIACIELTYEEGDGL